MSTDQLAAHLNEVPNKSTTGLIMGMAIKYGLPSVCCIWLFYVIWCKDQQIFSMAKETTMALAQSSSAQVQIAGAQERQNEAMHDLSKSIDNLSRASK